MEAEASGRLLFPEDDGLLYRESRPWAADKLDYVRRYIGIFTQSMHGKWTALRFIDLFAGPGKCRVKERDQWVGEPFLGSPLIAVTARKAFTDYYFVELGRLNYEALSSRLAPVRDCLQPDLRRGDANEVVHDIVAEIELAESRGATGLNLAFLDPEGFELRWSTVEALARLKRMDLIIYYSQMGVDRDARMLVDAPGWTAIDHYFGTQEWRNVYQACSASRRNVHRALMDFYKERLAALGYRESAWSGGEDEPAMRRPGTNQTVYRLLFASKHALGQDFWSKVLQREPGGQRAFDF